MKAAASVSALMTFPSWPWPPGTGGAEVRSEGRTCEVMKGSKWHQGMRAGAKWRRKRQKGGKKRRLMVLLKVGFVSLSDAAAAQLSRASVSALASAC